MVMVVIRFLNTKVYTMEVVDEEVEVEEDVALKINKFTI
jgi:hypothetical protein